MDLEDEIAAIIKRIYSQYEDEGRSDEAAHEIMALVKQAIAKRECPERDKP
jgi:hypothetical protein